MSSDIQKARKLLSGISVQTKQGKSLAAAQALRDAILAAFKQPLMKSEREEIVEMVQKAIGHLNSDKNLRQHYPLIISYEPGKEKALLATVKEVITELHNVMQESVEDWESIKAERMKKALKKGDELISEEEYDKAKHLYDRLLKEFHHDPELVAEIADKFIQIGRYEYAFEYLEAALENDPQAIFLYNRIGIVLRKMQDYETAEKYYMKALDVAEADEFLWFNIGRLYIDWSKWGKVKEAAEKAMEINPDFAEAKKMRDFAKKKMGD
ncbi:MAG: tetratricopeptide repeat protein [Desulfovibrionaceae bacterium]